MRCRRTQGPALIEVDSLKVYTVAYPVDGALYSPRIIMTGYRMLPSHFLTFKQDYVSNQILRAFLRLLCARGSSTDARSAPVADTWGQDERNEFVYK